MRRHAILLIKLAVSAFAASILLPATARADTQWWWNVYPNPVYPHAGTATTPTVYQGTSPINTIKNPAPGTWSIGKTYSTQPPTILIRQTGKVVQVAAGVTHSLLLERDGTVWGVGDNTAGQLALPAATTQTGVWTKAALVPANTTFSRIAACYKFSMAVTSDGRLYTAGINGKGQLGQGGTAQPVGFQPALNASGVQLSNVVDVACGWEFAVALTGDGQLWSAGDNAYGQLGRAAGATSPYFGKVVYPASASGANVFSFALGAYYQVALNATSARYAQADLQGAGDNTSCQQGGSVGYNNGGSLANQSTGSLAQVVAGRYHTLYFDFGNQRLLGLGSNVNGELGDPSIGAGPFCTGQVLSLPAGLNGSNITMLGGGYDQSFLFTNTGTLYAAGANQYGQTGTNANNATVKKWRPVPMPTTTPPTTVVQASSSLYHTLILTNRGDVMAAGTNFYQQMGTPVQSSIVFVLADPP